MALFNLGKKVEREGNISPDIQSVKVIGGGCRSCHELYENAQKALKAAGSDIEAEYITDMEKVMSYGIMSMPGLVVNEKVVSAGRVLSQSEVEKLLCRFDG